MEIMEFNDFILFFKKNLRVFLIAGIVGSLIGVLVFFVTGESYVSQGTFLIKPQIVEDISKEDLEILDSLASSYTQTLVGFFNSPEVKNKVLETVPQEKSLGNLFFLNFKTSAKEISPRLVVLTVGGGSYDEAEKVFYSYEREVLEVTKNLRDEKLFQIERLSDFPLTTKIDKNLVFYFLAGYLIGFFSFLIILFIKKNYDFKE